MVDVQFAGYTPEQMYNLLEYTPERATPEQVRAIGECLRELKDDYEKLESLADQLSYRLEDLLRSIQYGDMPSLFEIEDANQALEDYRSWIMADHNN